MTNLTKQFTIKNTDWAIAGAGDARDGETTVSVSGVKGTPERVLLYWGELNFSGSSDATIDFNGTSVTGTRLGTSVDTCWSSDHSLGYFADITKLVSGNGDYTISGMGEGGQGASIVTLFDDGKAANNRDVTFYAGNDASNSSGAITTINLGNVPYQSGKVNVTLSVGDGQSFTDGELAVNGTSLGSDQFPGGSGALWDVNRYDITSVLSKGDNAVRLTHESRDDCLQFVSAIVDSPAELPVLFLDFDTRIPIDYYVKPASFLGLLGLDDREVIDTRAGTEPLGRFQDAEKARLVDLVQAVFDRSGIAMDVTQELPDAGDYHSVRFSSTRLTYDADGDGSGTVRLLGEAFQGIDRFDQDKNNIVAVLMDGRDDLDFVAETVVHEGAHAFGARHINPVEGRGTEVMDYDDRGTETFWSRPALIAEPPIDGEAATRTTHNPTYHIRRHLNGDSDTQLRDEGIRPGGWDTSAFERITYALDLGSLKKPLSSLSVLLTDQSPLVEGLEPGVETGRLVSLGEDLGNRSKIEFTIDEGESFRIVGARRENGPLDVALAFDPDAADPYSFKAGKDAALSGDLVVDAPRGPRSIGTAELDVTKVTEVTADGPEGKRALQVTIDRAAMSESGGTAVVTISRGRLSSGALELIISSDDTSEAAIEVDATIPDGAREITLDLTALDDFLPDGAQLVTISALAEGFETGSAQIEVLDNESDLIGTVEDDALDGTEANDAIYGLQGKDTLTGFAGDDTLAGHEGKDRLIGRAGDDIARGGAGRDTLLLGAGRDTGQGGDGADLIRGGGGRDQLSGDDGDDRLFGQGGRDALFGGVGDDQLHGGKGNDRIVAGSGNDRAWGDAGNDTLLGQGGRDRLRGGEGEDQIKGNGGKDRLWGDGGDDLLIGGGGADRLLGGDGDDVLRGGGGSDVLIGGAGDNTLSGNKKPDLFVFSNADGVTSLTDFEARNNREDISLAAVDEIETFRDLQRNHMTQRGDDVRIDDGAGTVILLRDVSMDDLDARDFQF